MQGMSRSVALPERGGAGAGRADPPCECAARQTLLLGRALRPGMWATHRGLDPRARGRRPKPTAPHREELAANQQLSAHQQRSGPEPEIGPLSYSLSQTPSAGILTGARDAPVRACALGAVGAGTADRLSARRAIIVDMKNATHQAIGAAMALAVCAALDSGAAMAAGALGASVLGSRLPDVDQPGARIHRGTRLERRSIGVELADGALRLPMAIFARVGRHRGATHWLLSGDARPRGRRTHDLGSACRAGRDRNRLRLLGSSPRRCLHAAWRPVGRPAGVPPRAPAASRASHRDRSPERPLADDHGCAGSRGPRGRCRDIAVAVHLWTRLARRAVISIASSDAPRRASISPRTGRVRAATMS